MAWSTRRERREMGGVWGGKLPLLTMLVAVGGAMRLCLRRELLRWSAWWDMWCKWLKLLWGMRMRVCAAVPSKARGLWSDVC